MKLILITFALAVGILTLSRCDETPSDIHERLLPRIAEELIQNHNTPRISGLTPEIIEVLRGHSSSELRFTIGTPDLHGKYGPIASETGISVFKNTDGKCILALGLMLNGEKTGYILDGYSIGGISRGQ